MDRLKNEASADNPQWIKRLSGLKRLSIEDDPGYLQWIGLKLYFLLFFFQLVCPPKTHLIISGEWTFQEGPSYRRDCQSWIIPIPEWLLIALLDFCRRDQNTERFLRRTQPKVTHTKECRMLGYFDNNKFPVLKTIHLSQKSSKLGKCEDGFSGSLDGYQCLRAQAFDPKYVRKPSSTRFLFVFMF